MIKRRYQDRDPGAVAAQGEVVLDLIGVGHRPEVPLEIGHGNVEFLQVPLHAREEEFAAAVDVVVGMKYDAVVCYKKLRDGGQHALAGERDGTAGEERGCVLHWLATCAGAAADLRPARQRILPTAKTGCPTSVSKVF